MARSPVLSEWLEKAWGNGDAYKRSSRAPDLMKFRPVNAGHGVARGFGKGLDGAWEGHWRACMWSEGLVRAGTDLARGRVWGLGSGLPVHGEGRENVGLPVDAREARRSFMALLEHGSP